MKTHLYKFTILFLVLLFSGYNVLAQVPNYVPTNGLVAYWPFNGNANDESGNGNHGTVNGATLTTDRFGVANKAYFFSSSGCSTRIDASVNTTSIQTGLTISIWVLKSGNGCIGPRLFEFWPGNNGPGIAQWGWDNSTTLIGMGSQTSSGFNCNFGVPIKPVNQWTHLVYTNNGTVGKFYQDGILLGTVNSTGNPILASSLAMGRMNHPAYDAFNGKLDDMCIWNRALTQQEISALYTSNAVSTALTCSITTSDSTLCLGQSTTLSVGNTPPSSTNCGTLTGSLANGLVGYWPFCGNANDLSGNGNNGTVNGATLTTDRFGNANSAYSFDGNDWISSPRAHHSSFSSSVWVQATNTNCTKPILDAGNSSWELYSDCLNGHLSFIMWNGSAYTFYPTNVILGPNTWYNIVCVYSNSQIMIYVNGILITTQTTTTIPAISGVLNIGGSISGSLQFFTGKLDDIALWNRILTISEIQQLYSQGQSTYSWSPGGATTPTITVSPTQTTTYTVTTTVNGVSCSDSITVSVDSLNFSLPPTTTVCGTTTTLTAPAGATSYLWNTGATTAAISPTTSGLYSCIVTKGACVKSDTTQVTLVNSTITTTDSTLCLGQSTTLSVGSTPLSSSTNCGTLTGSLANGLVGYWPFCGNANDLSGNGNNGTVNGATLTTDRFGNANSAYNFDGTNSIIIPDNPNLILQNGTISFWFKTNSPNPQMMVSKRNIGSANNQNFSSVFYNNEVTFSANYNSNCQALGAVYCNSSGNYNSNWYNFSATISYDSLRVFINGILINSTIVPNSLADYCSGSPILIGRTQDVFDWFIGQLDDIAIYNRALSASEIQQLYTQGQTTYSWSPGGATTPTITVSPTATTTYTCTTTVNGVSCSDSITITVDSLNFSLPATTTICGATTTLTAPSGATSYLWNTGATTASISPTTSGSYSCIVTQGACSISDTTQLTLMDSQITASASSICNGTPVNLAVNVPPSANAAPSWELLIPATEYNGLQINLSETGYDRVNNYIFSLFKQGSNLIVYRFNLNNNTVSTITTTNNPSNVGPFTYDYTNNRLITGRSGRDPIYAVSANGGTWNQLGTGSFDSESYGAQYYWNPNNQKTGFFGGYGFYTVKNWLWESGGSWTNVFSNTNNCGTTIPAKRNTQLALGAPNSNKIYFFSGQGSCSGQQTASSCNLGSPWATDVGVYCWLKDLWELDLSTYTFNNILPVNNSSITQEGNFVYNFNENSFYIIGGYTPSPTYNSNIGNILNYETSVLKFNPINNSGFVPFSVQGTPPPTVTLNNLGNNKTYFDSINNQIVWIRKDGVWAIKLDASSNSTSILWSTGETTPTITVSPTQTTTYTVTTTVNGVSCSDSITVSVDSLNFSLPPTTTVCGTTTTLTAPAGATSYLWNTGATTAAISPTTSGSYSCTVTQGACSVSDTTQLTIMDPSISASDTLICLGQNTTLSVNNINLTTPCNLAITPSSIPLGQPKPGFTFAGVFNNHYYYVYNSPTSWTQGDLICRQNGGYLACINDAAEDAYVTSLTTNNIWIGLFRNPQTCSFEWLDCSTVNYTNWRPGEPNSGPCGEPYGQIIRGCSFGMNTWNNLDNVSSNGSCYSNMYPILEIDPQFQQGNTSILWSNGATTPTITVSPTQTTTYTVTTTVNGVSCSDSLTIVVDTALAVVTLSGPTTFCASDSLQLTANPGSSYQWSTNETTQSITVNQSGTYSVIVTNASGCTAYSTNTVVTVQPLPVVFAGNDTSICFADTLTLVGSGATSYSWNAGVSNGIAFVPTSSATYTLTGVDTNGCVNTDQINITVNPLPTINAGADQFVCIGASATLQAVGGVSYSWNNGISDNTPFTPTNTLNYTVTGTDINGCVNTDQVTVTVNPLPNVSAGQDQALCLGTSLSLIGSGAATYSWNNGVINNNLFSPTATATYTVTGTDINGCVSSDQVVVTVQPLPVVFAGNDTSICFADTLTLVGSGATSYSWNAGVSNGIAFVPTSSATYTLTGIDTNGCVNTDQINITVNPLPTINAGADQFVCIGASATLQAVGGVSYSWNNGISDNTPFTPTNTLNYTVTGIDINGCVNTDQVTVTVNPLPNVSAGQDQALCLGTSLSLIGSGAATYLWNNGVINNNLFTPNVTTTYTVTGTDINGCVNSDQVVVTVHPLPIVSAGNDTTVCAGEPLVFSGSGAGFYLWNNGITNATTFSATTTSAYVVTGIDNNNCIDTDTLQLIVEPLPVISASPDIQICAGELVTLSATSNGTIQWNNGVIDNTPFQPTTTSVYTVSSLGTNGCENTEQVLVTVNPLPNANFNTPYFSQGSPNTTFNFTNTSTNSDQVVWDFGDGVGSSTMNNPMYTYPLVSGTYPVTLIVVSDFGCTDTVMKIVRVINNSISSEVIIPTGFSPNNDGANDTWTITGLANYPQASINVFNRWGQKIFEGNSTNYSWDGTFNNQLQPVADYYYIIELNDATKYNGIVTLKY